MIYYQQLLRNNIIFKVRQCQRYQHYHHITISSVIDSLTLSSLVNQFLIPDINSACD